MDNRKCLICEQIERYSTTAYSHAYKDSDIKYATCKPPQPFGKHICWNCGITEEKASDEKYYKRHDFVGNGIYTCIAPAPQGKYRCYNCEDIVDNYDDHYHDFDQGGYYKCSRKQHYYG